MRRTAFLVGPALASFVIVASCGARTGLDIPPRNDASVHAEGGPGKDATLEAAHDALADSPFADVTPIQDSHFLDVKADCDTPRYCVSNDPQHVYKCGVAIEQCSSLEQCVDSCPDGGSSDASGDASNCTASCVNPCLNSLGQNTSNGCDFYAAEMDMIPTAEGVCYAVFVVNEWPTGEPAKLAVDFGGAALPPLSQFAKIPSGFGQNITYADYPATGIPPNGVAILFLSRDTSEDQGQPYTTPVDPAHIAKCPAGITPALITDAALHGTGVGSSFHIRSNVPVVAYQMLPYGGGSARITGATLLLPTNVWGTNYLGVNAYAWPQALLADGSINVVADGLENAGPSMVILAQANDTHVTINPVTDIVAGGGLAGTRARVPITYTVNQGQYLQFTQRDELTGSAIQSDRPVALIAGSTIMDIPVSRLSRADHGEQMIPPVQALGSTYVGVRYRTRSPGVEESVPWRIVGAVDGTILSFDPPEPTAPAEINANQLIEFDATGPFVVSSQDSEHPFYFAQYMTGGLPFQGEGDPDYVNVVSPAQYLSKYTFFTDPTYPETNLVVVRALDGPSGTFPTVTLDCAGVLTGFQPVGSSGLYEFTRIDLSTGVFVGQNGCNNGVHTITGSFPAGDAGDASTGTPLFGVTIWGWGNTLTDPLGDDSGAEIFGNDAGLLGEADPRFTRWVSYGYPAGANILKLNSVVVSAH